MLPPTCPGSGLCTDSSLPLLAMLGPLSPKAYSWTHLHRSPSLSITVRSAPACRVEDLPPVSII